MLKRISAQHLSKVCVSTDISSELSPEATRVQSRRSALCGEFALFRNRRSARCRQSGAFRLHYRSMLDVHSSVWPFVALRFARSEPPRLTRRCSEHASRSRPLLPCLRLASAMQRSRPSRVSLSLFSLGVATGFL